MLILTAGESEKADMFVQGIPGEHHLPAGQPHVAPAIDHNYTPVSPVRYSSAPDAWLKLQSNPEKG